MGLEQGISSSFIGSSGSRVESPRRADQAVMTIPRDSFNFHKELVEAKILALGKHPATVNPHEELVIKIPNTIHTFEDVQSRILSIHAPEGMHLQLGKLYETVDFNVVLDTVTDDFIPRLRMAFQDGMLRDMRYLFAKNSANTIPWAPNLDARVENVIAVMRKYDPGLAMDQKSFDYMTILRFFTDNCQIFQIVHKQNQDISFSPDLDRVYKEAGLINDMGEKVSVTHSHGINSVDYFMKGVISQTTRRLFSPHLTHEYGLGISLSLRNGHMSPRQVFEEVFDASEDPSLGVDIELRGDDAYRSLAAEIGKQIITATGSTEYGALARKGNLVT